VEPSVSETQLPQLKTGGSAEGCPAPLRSRHTRQTSDNGFRAFWTPQQT
jgi:hypothetical protein